MAAAKLETTPEVMTDPVFTKYCMAGDIANRVMLFVIGNCKAGKPVLELSIEGDKLILEETDKIFRKEKSLKKGIAFPTSLSVNHCACNYNPSPDSDKGINLKDGDVVKIDLGVHIDGYIATIAHTIVVGISPENKVSGRKADVILAAFYASEILQRLIKPGGQNFNITEKITLSASEFNTLPIEGIISHDMEQNRMLGEKRIIQNPGEALRKEYKKCSFVENEVYNVDVLFTTGEGKLKQSDMKPTIFRRTESAYKLKLQTARVFTNEVTTKFGNMPFTMRAIEDLKSARMGVTECVNHQVMEPYDVMFDKEGEFVAQFKYTVILRPSGNYKITGIPFDCSLYESEFSIKNEELVGYLSQSTSGKKNKKKKKGKTNEIGSEKEEKNSEISQGDDKQTIESSNSTK
ncbi:hypothetical protein LOD99_3611 [Oopsacas minuta]|uniref:Peptidase M24 domain-containing protein n=1 Tax=Oopsacas minuta TaxID=111878 RepID=A0AAV7JX09_9METZ|nr:hypothetical protein LOD99_3611 [Oopsacas minuta]